MITVPIMEGDEYNDLINYYVDCDYRIRHNWSFCRYCCGREFPVMVRRYYRIQFDSMGSHQTHQTTKKEMSPITRALSLCIQLRDINSPYYGRQTKKGVLNYENICKRLCRAL